MGKIYSVPRGTWSTCQSLQIEKTLTCSLNKYLPRVYSVPMLHAVGTEINKTCSLSQGSSFHIHHPIPFDTQAHNCFVLLLVLRHKHCLHEICKASRKCTGPCIFYLVVTSNTMIVTWQPIDEWTLGTSRTSRSVELIYIHFWEILKERTSVYWASSMYKTLW